MMSPGRPCSQATARAQFRCASEFPPGEPNPPCDQDVGGQPGAVHPGQSLAGVQRPAAPLAAVVRAGAVPAAAPHVGQAEQSQARGDPPSDPRGPGADHRTAHLGGDVRVVRQGHRRPVHRHGHPTGNDLPPPAVVPVVGLPPPVEPK